MIAFTRRTARRFVAAAAKCVAGRPRGPAPPVVLRRSGGRVTLTAAYPEVVLELAGPSPTTSGTDGLLVVPAALVEEVEGATDDVVEVRDEGRLKGTAWWPAHGGTRSDPVALILPGRQHDAPALPKERKAVPGRLLTALHECGRGSCRLDGRFALSRVQMKGKGGQVVGTDGCSAVIYSGFAFPFADELLVPAVPLFGCPELRASEDVRLGRTSAPPPGVVAHRGRHRPTRGMSTTTTPRPIGRPPPGTSVPGDTTRTRGTNTTDGSTHTSPSPRPRQDILARGTTRTRGTTRPGTAAAAPARSTRGMRHPTATRSDPARAQTSLAPKPGR